MEAIKSFLSARSGYGYGSGSGSGSGDGYGYGYGDGDGYGYGYGDGDGYGDGSGSGSGDGYGFGYGYGSGSGSGFGDGFGDGFGYGYGNGSGYGYGSGNDIKTFGEHIVYMIDNVATIITRVIGNLAKGFILNDDLTLSPCFVVKGQHLFAHGETVKAAQAALQEKIFERMDTGEKIDAFLDTFKLGKKYPAKVFYEWHHKLTGSCEMGRNAFCTQHNIDLENGMYTVEEFIEITESDYGGEIIKHIRERTKKNERLI